jgi:PAS domain S-box-containing protein
MKDQMKTKKQLVNEMMEMRQHIIELEQTATKSEQAEELLQTERETFFPVLQKAPYGVAMIDKEGNFLYINSEFTNITGYTLEDLLAGRSWFNKVYVFPEYRQEIITTWKNDIIQRGIEKVFTIVCKKGEIKEIEFKPTLLSDTRIIVMLSDITEQRRVEKSLRESEAKYRSILESITEGYYEVDIAGNFTFVNDSVCQMLGHARDELIGVNNRQYTDIENAKKLYQAFNKVYKAGEATKGFDWEVIRKDGTIRSVESSISLIKDSKGQPTGFRGIVRDITERKLSEEALKEALSLISATLESTADGILVVDREGKIASLNKKFVEMWAIPESIIELHDDNQALTFVMDQLQSPENFLAKVRDLYAKPDAESFDILNFKDGRIFERYSKPQCIGDQIVGRVWSFRNITEQKKAEKALQKSEEEAKRLAQENAIMAEIGRIISSTLNIEDVYGLFAEEVHKLIPFDRIAINIINVQEGTITIAYVTGIEVKDRLKGDIIPLRGSANEEMIHTRSGLLIQTENGDELGNRYPTLLNNIRAGLRSMISVPLISKDQVVGALHFRSLTPKAYSESDLMLAERVGNQIAGAIANAQLFSDHERSEREKVALEEQLRQSQRMEAIGRLAGGIAHDFNNLLTVISGNCQLSLLELMEGDPLRGNIEEIKKAADRAAILTRQLLAFSRRQILEFRVLHLNSIIRDMGKMLHRVIGEDIELVTLLAEDLGKVRTDSGQIEQVILNLAVNAKDAMPNGGKLIIETANVDLDEEYAHAHIGMKPGSYVRLSVSDTGAGMKPEVRERVFEPFFTTKDKGKGTGLGLSTVYGIVKQSGGYIWVYSEEGYGTTFKIYLPQVEEPVEFMGKKIEDKEAPRGRETILLVEDEEAVRKLGVQFLKKQGYTVLEAIHGSDALMICEQHRGPVALMVTDVVMPGMSGRDLSERLKSICPGMKVLYMSGYTDEAIVHHGVLEKGIHYIQKPFSMEALAKKVREVLDKG